MTSVQPVRAGETFGRALLARVIVSPLEVAAVMEVCSNHRKYTLFV
jgi:hypothetical protein